MARVTTRVSTTDAFTVYRGTEENIADIAKTPIKDGNVYFAYDNDVIYFDAQAKRHRVAGGGDVSFLKCHGEPVRDIEHDEYLFDRGTIDAEKLGIDNILITDDNVLYRVIEITEDEDHNVTVHTKIIAGGGGAAGGGGGLTIVEASDIPARALITQPLSITLRFGSSTTTDKVGAVKFELNGEELTYLSNARQELRVNKTFTIPANNLINGTNTIHVELKVNGVTQVYETDISGIRAEFKAGNSWNQRQPYTPSETPDTGLLNTITFPFVFNGLDAQAKTVTGIVRTYIDDEEIVTTAASTAMDNASGYEIGNIVTNTGSVIVNCAVPELADIPHGMHVIRFDGYVLIGGEAFPVDSYEYEIIWVTDEGGSTPIIISSYPAVTTEENYNVIEIPYVIYARGLEKVSTHLYLNNNELATSPIQVTWDNKLLGWNTWRITNYVSDIAQQPNSFQMTAQTAQTSVSKTWSVTITKNSSMDLDPVTDNLLLYLTAKERSNKEVASKRGTWNYGSYTSTFTGFNWYNNGWTTDDDGDEVLRLSNGAKVEVNFNGILQESDVGNGFTIEAEFKCRNAINFSKLLNLTAVDTYATDDNGDPIYDSFGNRIIEKTEITKTIKTNPDGTVQNAVGYFFGQNKGFCFGTQEAFFASSGHTVNVRYADGEKVKVSVVASKEPAFLYIYINGVLSGLEEFKINGETFDTGSAKFIFNSDYCDLDLYNIRVYGAPLDFDDIVTNWIADAPNLDEKRQRYLENHITTKYVNREGTTLDYVTIDYESARRLSDALEENYQKQLKLGVRNISQIPRGLPIMVVSSYPYNLTQNNETAKLPYQKGNIKYCDFRYYDPADKYQEDPSKRKSFKVQDFEFDVQGTSSQGYPIRNYKAKFKKPDPHPYLNAFPFYMTTWDGDDAKREIWPSTAEEVWNGSGFEEREGFEIKDGLVCESFCLKADYMDSSSSHNTPGANLVDFLSVAVNDANLGSYDLRHPLKRILDNNDLPYRTTVYGYPALLFWDFKDPEGGETTPTFIGRYNFNIHKGQDDAFGFEEKSAQTEFNKNADATYFIPVKYMGDKDSVEALTAYTESLAAEGKTPGIADGYIIGTDVYGWDGHEWIKAAENFTKIGTQKTKKTLKDVNKTLAPLEVKVADRPATYKEIAECWELTSNQHGFTGFTRNDFTAYSTTDYQLDFFKFFECRYHIMDPGEAVGVYASDPSATKATARRNLSNYCRNIWDLSRWIYSTNVHYWDNEGQTDWEKSPKAHKLTALADFNDVLVLRDSNHLPIVDENNHPTLLRDYYVKDNEGLVTKIPENLWAYDNGWSVTNPLNGRAIASAALIFEDEINGLLLDSNGVPQDQYLHTLDTDFQVLEFGTKTIQVQDVDEETGEITMVDEVVPDESQIVRMKTYYFDVNSEPIPLNWFARQAIFAQGSNEQIIGYKTVCRNPQDSTDQKTISEVYEKYDRDNKNYRLSKYRSELRQHFNFDYMCLYAILTDLLILYDSREKNMMLATYGPEQGSNGNYVWYPIFYDLDTQLGINNSGSVYWDYDVNAQADGIFSGAGSVLWDNFFACFLDDLKKFYRLLRVNDNGIKLQTLIDFYNTRSANCWTPIMKNCDAFYKYIGPSLGSVGYVNQSGEPDTRSDMFYCAQGDRSLNRTAFFRNRLNYKDSEWLAGSYRTQGGSSISMRYDANWTGTSDPDASDIPVGQKNQYRLAGLDANATFTVQPYLTQYCSAYFDEIPTTPARYDIVTDEGYIEIPPLSSIQEQIDAGQALSQQLVYIYGPEYIRDLGDLSLKYLDMFFASAAVRLNSLIIGNDNPLYKNGGMNSGTLQLDSSYTTSEGKLNANAKALLETLDVSNIAGLNQTLDVSGCLKLKTLKTLGTNLLTIDVAKGNVLRRAYFPATMTALNLIQSQALNTVVRNRELTYSYNGNTPAEGLYYENITDKMNVKTDEDFLVLYQTYKGNRAGAMAYLEENHREVYNTIPGIMESDPITYTSKYTPCPMDQYVVAGGKLGFYSYEMLDYIIKEKIRMYWDKALSTTDATIKRTVRIECSDVQWTPFEKQDVNASEISGAEYWVRNDDLTYSTLASLNKTFRYAQENLGGVYLKNNNKLTYDPSNNEVKNGIPNLNLFKVILQDYEDNTLTKTGDGQPLLAQKFQTAASITGSSAKYLPTITGEVYVDNASGTAIDEYDLYDIMTKFNARLDEEETKLVITAAQVNPCPRAKFVVVSPEGIQQEHATYRARTRTEKVPVPSKPVRNHYDFMGWTTDDSVVETCSVVTDDSEVLENLIDFYPAHSNDYNVTFVNPDNNNIAQTTYYAVFVLHKYKIRYILDYDAYVAGGDNPPIDSYETVLVPSGSIVGQYPPKNIPFKTQPSQQLTKVWAFKGWSVARDSGTGTYNVVTDMRTISQKDLERWPVFREESVYDNPIPNEWLQCHVTRNGYAVLYGVTRHLGGKVCIPKLYTNGEGLSFPIVQVMGPDVSSQDDLGNIVYQRVLIEGTTFTPGGDWDITNRKYAEDGPLPPEGYTGNGFQHNSDITHVFFQGYPDKANLTSIGANAFYGAYNLVWCDFPTSCTSLGTNSLAGCNSLIFASLDNVTSIGQYALQNVGTTAIDHGYGNYSRTLTLSHNLTNYGMNCLGQAGWQIICFGTYSDRNSNGLLVDFPTLTSGGVYKMQQNNLPYSPEIDPSSGSNGVQKIYFYGKNYTNEILNDPSAVVNQWDRSIIEVWFNEPMNA